MIKIISLFNLGCVKILIRLNIRFCQPSAVAKSFANFSEVFCCVYTMVKYLDSVSYSEKAIFRNSSLWYCFYIWTGGCEPVSVVLCDLWYFNVQNLSATACRIEFKLKFNFFLSKYFTRRPCKMKCFWNYSCNIDELEDSNIQEALLIMRSFELWMLTARTLEQRTHRDLKIKAL